MVMQSGGGTAVLNRSLAGIVREASESNAFNEIYGASHGLEGVLKQDLINIGGISKSQWKKIARTSGAALGSTRHKVKDEDVPTILKTLSENDIRFLFIIGGNDSAKNGCRLLRACKDSGYELTIMNVPKTIDNDLVLTDHSPGYGSAARFVGLATMGAGRDAQSMGHASPITIIEVMGRDAGWLAASSALAMQDEGDAPHFILVPEVPLDEERLLDRIEDVYRRYEFVVIVMGENVRGPTGVLGNQQIPRFVDDFGHPYYDAPGQYLADVVAEKLKVRSRFEKPGTIQRSFMESVSSTDAHEAELVGQAAVRYALKGHNEEMVTLIREPGDGYFCTTGTAPLEDVAGQVRAMPPEYLDIENLFVTDEFISYAKPLIGAPLPRMGKVG